MLAVASRKGGGGIRNQRASRLDSDAGLSPMPPLGVVPVRESAVVRAPADAGCKKVVLNLSSLALLLPTTGLPLCGGISERGRWREGRGCNGGGSCLFT